MPGPEEPGEESCEAAVQSGFGKSGGYPLFGIPPEGAQFIEGKKMANVDAIPDTPGELATRAPLSLDAPVFTFLLVKLASRCNIICTYCYWLRDADVYKKPAVLTIEAEDAFCRRLEEHIVAHELNRFMIIFHGGEPLLFPKYRFVDFQKKLLAIEERTACAIERIMCTNAVLIDEEWVRIFNRFNVHFTVSLDGPPDIHDKYRFDFKGRGTHAATLRGIARLRAGGIEPSISIVCDPATDPERLLSHIVDELGIAQFDVLAPDATHNDNPPQVDVYFIRLFDIWYDKYAARGVQIGILNGMIQGLFGEVSVSGAIGFGPIDTVTLMTDGGLEPLDVLRIAGNGFTRTELNVSRNALQDVQRNPCWRDAFEASTNLCETCQKCEYRDACGGGHLAHRWSPERKYDNPSVYCQSWKNILDHIWRRVSPTLVLN